ncbi:unnamed protein product [Miscanthus lutarioriparius]|uniref:Uncharacterized protein n=1 Tax=Miscanthus lutarioriparius TaxID=422564 RepID=A0A811MXA1_9POAL|nr:unnamed protein product [Miscanthus lutarioriparius]
MALMKSFMMVLFLKSLYAIEPFLLLYLKRITAVCLQSYSTNLLRWSTHINQVCFPLTKNTKVVMGYWWNFLLYVVQGCLLIEFGLFDDKGISLYQQYHDYPAHPLNAMYIL